MNIFDEAEKEDLQIKSILLFKKLLYASLVIAFIAIASIAYYKYFENRMRQNSFAVVDLLLKVNQENSAESLATLSQALKLSKNYTKDLAAIKISQIEFKNNNPIKAKEILYDIITGNYKEITKSYARLLWASYNLDNFLVDSKNDKINMHDLLMASEDKSNVFYGQLNIIKALWFVQEKQKEQAVITLKNLATSDSLVLASKKMAQIILHQIETQ